MKPLNKRIWINFEYLFNPDDKKEVNLLRDKIHSKINKSEGWQDKFYVDAYTEHNLRHIYYILEIGVQKRMISKYMRDIEPSISKMIYGDERKYHEH